MPTGFSVGLTGDGASGEWAVREDAQAFGGRRVLAQSSSDRTDYRFPVCVYDGVSAKDVEVWVRFKAVSGEVDRAGGIVARYQDQDNYYIVRANAIENNVRLYRLVGGKRWQIAGVDAQVTAGEWHMLRLAVKGSRFSVSFDGRLLFEADDSAIRDAGKVGVWTKSDSVAHFDDLKIEAHDQRTR